MSVIAKAIAYRQSEIERLQAEIKALNDVDKIQGCDEDDPFPQTDAQCAGRSVFFQRPANCQGFSVPRRRPRIAGVAAPSAPSVPTSPCPPFGKAKRAVIRLPTRFSVGLP